jgi:hypothetical protein
MPWALFSLGSTLGRLFWTSTAATAVVAVPLLAGSSQTEQAVEQVAPSRKLLTSDNIYLMATVAGLIYSGIAIYQFINKGK